MRGIPQIDGDSLVSVHLRFLGSHVLHRTKAKVFRNSAITNLHEFFGRFGALNVHSDAQLDELVARARRLVDGTLPQDVRTDDALRQRIAEGVGSLRGSLDELLVDKPRRCILRSRSEGAHAAAG